MSPFDSDSIKSNIADAIDRYLRTTSTESDSDEVNYFNSLAEETEPEDLKLEKIKGRSFSLREGTKALREIHDLELREKFARRIYNIVIVWLIFVSFLLLQNSNPIGMRWDRISDNVMITILGTATGGVVGLLAIIANYLFPKSHR